MGAQRKQIRKPRQTSGSRRGRGPARERTERRHRDTRDNGGSTYRGRLVAHPRGFGFVAVPELESDVFIPPELRLGAMHGDLVEVTAARSKKGYDGEVIHVLDRDLKRLTGKVMVRGNQTLLEPDDLRLRGPIPIEDVPRDFTRNPKKRADHVLAEVLTFPKYSGEVPTARFIKSLGPAGIATVEVEKIKIRDGIVEEFPEAVKAEAETVPTRLPKREVDRREDLRDLPLCTIDPEDARDHDDALWAERTRDGYRVVVAIADVAHYVRPGTAMDGEAQSRGCSVYLPDRAIPMLPPELSSHMASLVAGKDRFTMAVEIHLGPGGAVRKHRFIEGVMRCRAALYYDGVARALGLTHNAESQPEAKDHLDTLQVLLDISERLHKRRIKRGSLEFDVPEARVRLHPDTQAPIHVYRSRVDPGVRKAYNIVEEFMLLANEVVAQELDRLGVPTIFRVHGKPDEKKVEQFVTLAQALGFDMDAERAVEPRYLSGFIRSMRDTPNTEPLSYLLLRAMQQAVYQTTNIGHFGLAAKKYLHFTSPIRRYPDITVHRTVKRLLSGDDEQDDTSVLERLGELKERSVESSRLERRAMTAERDVVDLYRALLMRDRVGQVFQGQVSGVAGHGFYVSLDDPFVEVLCPIEALPGPLHLDDLGIRLVNPVTGQAWAMGMRLAVEVTEVSLEKRNVMGKPMDEPQRLSASELAQIKTKEGEQDDRGRRRRRSHRRDDTSTENTNPDENRRRRRPQRTSDSSERTRDDRPTKRRRGSPQGKGQAKRSSHANRSRKNRR